MSNHKLNRRSFVKAAALASAGLAFFRELPLRVQAKEQKNWQDVRRELVYWKNDSDMIAVREPAWLAAMPDPDRKTWRSFWADVDALLATIPTKSKED